MKKLYTEEEYKEAKSTDKLKCECYQCGNVFESTKTLITQEIKSNRGRIRYCSTNCLYDTTRRKTEVSCTHCGKEFIKRKFEISKSDKHFCSSSCNATYQNTHKSTGYRRSKLEIYLEEKLVELYPDMLFHFNRKDTINSELDIYIPNLNLAFELNGIFHYEPIYGADKLNQIQNNDGRKFQACLEKGISLCIIDTSSLKYFKPDNAKKYLDIIIGILVVAIQGVEP